MTRDRVLWLFGLGWAPEYRWALIGARWVSPAVGFMLSRKAELALSALAMGLYQHECEGRGFDITLIGRAAAEVNRCGDFWPGHGCKSYEAMGLTGMDMPAAWGVQSIRNDLELLFADVACGTDRGCTLSEVGEARDAADAMLDLLSNGIGSPFASGPPTPGTGRREAAWKRFHRTLGIVAPVMILPVIDICP